jgi:hypothetical protein
MVAIAVKRRFETRGVIISVSSPGRERAPGEIAINRIADRNGADFLHVLTYLELSRSRFNDELLARGGSNSVAERPKEQITEMKVVII